MNHLLHQITWHQYLSTSMIAAIIYYAVLIPRRYRPELKKIRQSLAVKQNGDTMQTLRYQASETGSTVPAAQPAILPESNSQESISAYDILAGKLNASIAKAADKPFAPAILIPQLRQILQQHEKPTATGRVSINRLIVNECEKTGTALLTEDEVDQWWER